MSSFKVVLDACVIIPAPLRVNVEAQSPDDFLVHLFHLTTESMIRILVEQARDLRNPPKTLLELLETLSLYAPTFVYFVQQTLSAHEDIYAWANSIG